jgi:hypothetical protein
VLARKRFAHELDVVKHRLAATPRLVPVITDTPNVLRRFRIVEDRPRALVDEIAIVVPHDDLLSGKTFAPDRRPKMVLQKIALLFGRENTRLPLLRSHRFILNREAPDRYALALVRFDEPREVVGPRLIKLRLQLAAAKHVVVVFHERGRAPRARKDVEPSAGRGQGLLDKRDAKLPVVVHTK